MSQRWKPNKAGMCVGWASMLAPFRIYIIKPVKIRPL